MSLHRSLRSTGKMKRHRSVLTRLERLKILSGKGAWDETKSPLGLPKVKHLKVTVKKEKAAAPAAAGEPGAAPVAGAPAAAKPAAGGAAQKPSATAKSDAAKLKK